MSFIVAYMCLRNQVTVDIGFSILFQLCFRFPAAILQKRVEISEIFLLHSLAHTYSGKVITVFFTIRSDSEQQGKNASGGKLPPPFNCSTRVKPALGSTALISDILHLLLAANALIAAFGLERTLPLRPRTTEIQTMPKMPYF